MTARCSICTDPIGPTDHVSHQVTGWERKALSASRKSGSDIKLREATGEVAHSRCVDRTADGIAVGQGALL